MKTSIRCLPHACSRFPFRNKKVTRLLNECEKHASSHNAQRAVSVKQDLKKHVKMSDAAKLWY